MVQGDFGARQVGVISQAEGLARGISGEERQPDDRTEHLVRVLHIVDRSVEHQRPAAHPQHVLAADLDHRALFGADRRRDEVRAGMRGIDIHGVVEAGCLVARGDEPIEHVVVRELERGPQPPIHELETRIVGAGAAERARLNAATGQKGVQRIVDAVRGNARPEKGDDIRQLIRNPIAVRIRVSQGSREAAHGEAGRAGTDYDIIRVKSGDEVEALPVLALVRPACAGGDLPALRHGESQIPVYRLRLAVDVALIELEVRQSVVVERDAQEHVLMFFEVVQAGSPGHALRAVGRGEAQLVSMHLRSRVPDQGAVVAVVPLRQIRRSQGIPGADDAATLHRDGILAGELVIPSACRVIRSVVQRPVGADVLHVQKIRAPGGIQRQAPVTRVLHRAEGHRSDLPRVADPIEVDARHRGLQKIDAAGTGALRAQVVPRQQRRQLLRRLQQKVHAAAHIVLGFPAQQIGQWTYVADEWFVLGRVD